MEQANNIEVLGHGVQCDAPECDYKYQFGEKDTYTAFLNKPCPKCGANLLTQEDHDAMLEIMQLVEVANTMELDTSILPQELQDLINQLEEPEKKAKLSIKVDNGIPVMSSDDPQVQSILDEIDAYYQSQAELIAKIDELEGK